MDKSGYARWFRDSTPYISMHRHKTFVVLLEGEALDHPNFVNIVHDLALVQVLGARLVVVHGARTQMASRLPNGKFHDGRRITAEEDLPVLLGVFGEMRARVEALFSTGLPTSPLRQTEISVVGGNFVTARPLGIIDGIDHQFTGATRRVHAERVHGALASGALVLLSPMGYSSSGQVFNLAADELAADVAMASNADKLIVFNDSGGLRDSAGIRISVMSPAELQSVADSDNHLLQTILRACRGGLKSAQLVSYVEDGALLRELFTTEGAGTQIRETGSEFIRAATSADVASIVEMIRPLEESGVLVRRPRDRLEAEIDHFLVAAIESSVIGCCALYPYDDTVELACVAVHPSFRDAERNGRPSVGTSLLEAAEKTARSMGAARMFVLTTQTRDWFLDNAFVDATLDDLPTPKQALYNIQRNSKVMIKQLESKA